MDKARPVTDEPVRGSIAPPWIFALPGIERMRLLARHLIPALPIAHLFGIGIGHVSAGSTTGTMKASGHMGFVPGLNVAPLFVESCYGAALTAVGPGFDVRPLTISTQYFRNPRPQPGNFLCRARVVNTSSLFVATAADFEDPVGRLVGSAIGQWAIKAVDSPPPSPPSSMEPVSEPSYATPDPPDRPPVGYVPTADFAARHSGIEIARMYIAGDLPVIPVFNTFGVSWDSGGEGTSSVTMPASEWFCSYTRMVSPGAIESLLEMTTTATALTLWAPGQSFAILEVNSRFLRPVPADGRLLSAHGRVTNREGNLVLAEVEAVDADGNVVAMHSASYSLLDPQDRPQVERERVLATLLFTDIVDSTARAERMGDAAWRRLLGEHHALVRQELGAHRGREVNTTGDGFLSRFESPASAIRCAKAIRDGVKRMHLEVRAGVHTGECEVHGADLAGIAVHVGARIAALAGPSEILVSQTVRDLAAGSGLRFAPYGTHTLKGVEGEYNLYEVKE